MSFKIFFQKNQFSLFISVRSHNFPIIDKIIFTFETQLLPKLFVIKIIFQIKFTLFRDLLMVINTFV